MPSYAKVAKVGVLWGFLSRGMHEIVLIPTSMILARLLTPNDFGIAAALAFFVQLAQRLTNFGFNSALVQRERITDQHTSTIFYVNVVLGVSAWGVLTLSASWLGVVFRSAEAAQAIPLAALSFVIGSIGSVPQALIVRDLRFRASALLDALYTWSAAGIGLGLAWYGFGYWSLVWCQVIAVCVQTCGRFYVAAWRPRLEFSWGALTDLLSMGIGLHAKRLLDAVAMNIDNLVVGRALGLSQLGLYDKAFTMMNRAVTAVNSAAPAVSFRIFAIISNDGPRFRSAYGRLLLISTLIAYPGFAWLIVVAPDLFLFMFGPQWTSAVLPFRVLCITGMLKTLNIYASTAAQATGWVWGEVWRQCIYITLIVVGVAAGSLWGLSGAAGGVLFASTVMTVLMHQLLRRAGEFSWSEITAPQVPALVCATGLVAWLGLMHAVMNALLGRGTIHYEWLLLSAVCAVLYMVAFLRLSRFSALRRVIADTAAELPANVSWVRCLITVPGDSTRASVTNTRRSLPGRIRLNR